MTEPSPVSVYKTIAYTVLALLAFAANSVLCRMALEMQYDGAEIDAASFTVIRLSSGIVALLGIVWLKSWWVNKRRTNTENRLAVQEPAEIYEKASRGSWFAAICLFLYAAAFSFAYVSLDTATGALILFGVVQMTMIISSLFSGNKLHYTEWLGVALAIAGFVYLMLPGATAPSAAGLVLMAISGIAWAFYTLAGKASKSPLQDTRYNFLRTAPLIMLLAIYNIDSYYLSGTGVMLAVASGALTSGLGYAIWYQALTALKTIQAAVLQLLVPVIAAVGGVIFVEELLTERLILSAGLVLGGILLVVIGRRCSAIYKI